MAAILDDRTMWSTDPEYYTSMDACEDVPSFILMQAYQSARATYYSCGGHWRAYRMELAMHALSETLGQRDITPEFTASNAIDVDHWSVCYA